MSGTVRIVAGAALLALAVALVSTSPAGAAFGPIRLLSATVPEQADEALAPAVAAAGRYVAFEGLLDEGRSGVFRTDLASGAVARVATGDAYVPGALGADSEAPSISADGRYVSFVTATRLDQVNDTAAKSKDVYVADMAAVPTTYELASALDGSSGALPGDSLAMGGAALSADGRKVAFVNGGQVYLRDLDAKRTTLVSVRRDPVSEAMEPGVPVPGGAAREVFGLRRLARGAALSADGSTVAWVGTNLPEQVPLLADEAAIVAELDAKGAFPYVEPLWRRVADGPSAPTRRIVGGGDPLAPGCPGTSGSFAIPACSGPFPGIASKASELNNASGWMGVGGVDGIPRLSADGRMVAVIGNPTEATNAFLVDMSAPSRTQAVRQLTRQVAVQPADEAPVVNRNPYVPLNGHIYDLAFSPDGSRLALTTARQQFPLAPPNLIDPPPAQLGLVELYLVDLETEALLRVTHGLGGLGEASLSTSGTGQGGDGAASPSLAAGGHLIAFASSASNLVPGDGNEADDVFAVEDATGAPVAGATSILPGPGQRTPRRRRKLALSAFSLPGGNVRLVAVVPGRGTLRARADAAIRATSRLRRLDAERARAQEGRPVKMTLKLPRRLRRLARTREGLYGVANVTFHSRRGRPLRGKVAIRFRAHRGGKKGERR